MIFLLFVLVDIMWISEQFLHFIITSSGVTLVTLKLFPLQTKHSMLCSVVLISVSGSRLHTVFIFTTSP